MTPTTRTHATQTAGTMDQDPLGPKLGDRSAPSDSESSVAAAYLKQFKEMVNLIEQLPDTPELIGDILKWQPTTYQDYFNAAAMPGRVSAADVYASLNRCVRQSFEGAVDDLDCKALGALAVIRRHYKTHGEARPDIMTGICARAGNHLREVLGKANDLVSQVPVTKAKFVPRHGASQA